METRDQIYGPNLTARAGWALDELARFGVLSDFEAVESERPTVARLAPWLTEYVRQLDPGLPNSRLEIARLIGILEDWADEEKLRAESAVLSAVLKGNAMARTVSNEHPIYVVETKLLFFQDDKLTTGEARSWVYDARTGAVTEAA